jgi:type IV secretory pathway VirB4 component
LKISRTKKTKTYIPKTEEEKEQVRIKEFLDMCAPSVLKFYPDYYICGSSFRSTWVVREYPTDTEEQALLKHLGDRSGVTLRVYTRHVTPAEERKIISNAASRNRMNRSSGNIQKEIIAESNLNDVMNLIAQMHRDREPLVHCAVFIEISTPTLEKLKEMQAEVEAELTRSKISVDKLFLRQKEGFESTQPCGNNAFHEQFERVIPATSAANLYPFNYSGKADPQGFYIGHDKYGSNLFIDFQRRTDDKTNANVLILGNSGQGKSYLMKLLLCNMRESGMDIVCLDPELEYKDLAVNMDGCYIDLMEGEYIINVLEPKRWEEDSGSVLPRHISFLRDFFRAYKDFTSAEIDVLEIFLEKLYESKGITEHTDFSELKHTDYPVLSDLYHLAEQELNQYEERKGNIYTRETVRDLCLKLKSICIGADSKFFNGHTNITSNRFICFGTKGITDADTAIRNAMLFNVLSFMSDALLSKGNTAAFIDELYLFLTNMTAIEYIRNAMKRVRKKGSAVIIASQNIEDFNRADVREMTKPMFAIPTHQFLFHPGNISKKEYMEMLRLDECLFDLISNPLRGVCVFRHGSEVYHLVVKAPQYKEDLFGSAGGK